MKTLDSMLDHITIVETSKADIAVSGISYDSRVVRSGELFIALPGASAHGDTFIEEALSKGACACVTETESQYTRLSRDGKPVVLVKDVRQALAEFSRVFYNFPDRQLWLCGITGTNGKTTVAYLAQAILNETGNKCSLVSTVEYRIGSKVMNARLTTPQASDYMEILSESVTKGQKALVMEASSQGLVFKRTYGCEYDCAVFTNLSPEHLDFHLDMGEYAKAKECLFRQLTGSDRTKPSGTAVINVDDPYSRQMISASGNATILTFGTRHRADITASQVNSTLDGIEFTLHCDGKNITVKSPLIGNYTVYNVMAAIGVAMSYGIEPEQAAKTVEKLTTVPGRCERMDNGQGPVVLVDFAHTSQALEALLSTLHTMTTGRLIVVFGCGGNRDRGKRPVMGEISVRIADYVIVTSDNPRSEDPGKIILDIEIGIRRIGKDNYVTQPDRQKAIRTAIDMAQKDDVVVIAGKGHETYQIIGDRRYEFSDREVARRILENNGTSNS